ncbi:hypothetical protein DFJ77DRAFT_468206 [Powellomyces hirtus]|nr:hypothetical protein DFJ77DRAFT_468206 [Powellomyces hirtus]
MLGCHSPTKSTLSDNNLDTQSSISSLPAICRTGCLTVVRRRTFGLSLSKSRVLLCVPRHTDHLFDILQEIYPKTTPATTSALRAFPHIAAVLGRLAEAAICTTALLVIVPESSSDEELDARPTYLDLASVVNVKDELELRETCTFALEIDAHSNPRDHWAGSSVKFRADFSVEYLHWVAAVREALALTPLRPQQQMRGAAGFSAQTAPRSGWTSAQRQSHNRQSRSMGRYSEEDLSRPHRQQPPATYTEARRHRSPRSQSVDCLNSASAISAQSATRSSDRPDKSQVSAATRVISANTAEVPSLQPQSPKTSTSAVHDRATANSLRLPSLRRVSWHGGGLQNPQRPPTRSEIAAGWDMPHLIEQQFERQSTTPRDATSMPSSLPTSDEKPSRNQRKSAEASASGLLTFSNSSISSNLDPAGPPLAYRRAQQSRGPQPPHPRRPNLEHHHTSPSCFPSGRSLGASASTADLRRDSGIGSSLSNESRFSLISSAPSDTLALSETSRLYGLRDVLPPSLPGHVSTGPRHTADYRRVPEPTDRAAFANKTNRSPTDSPVENDNNWAHHQGRRRPDPPRNTNSLDETYLFRMAPFQAQPAAQAANPRRSSASPAYRPLVPQQPKLSQQRPLTQPQQQKQPVRLAGSPSGPPSEIPDVPLISLTDARGPRVWSIRKQKWVHLHKKVPVPRQ